VTAPLRPVGLFDLPHHEARSLLARGVTVYLPVNPVEYHGPHLSLHNDHLVSMGLAADLHAAIGGGEPFVMAASIEAGVEPCPGPGTRGVSYRTLRGLVEDACAALADLGAKRVVIMTFHGAPLHAMALDAAVRLLEKRGVRAIQPHNLIMREMMHLDASQYADAVAHVEDPEERAAMLRELPGDFHAGFSETSISLHYAPESVSPIHKTLPPCPPVQPDRALLAASKLARSRGRLDLAIELQFAALGRGWGALRPFPGYTGRPQRDGASRSDRRVRLIGSGSGHLVAAGMHISM
jgi:creatinine amidohydrolase